MEPFDAFANLEPFDAFANLEPFDAFANLEPFDAFGVLKPINSNGFSPLRIFLTFNNNSSTRSNRSLSIIMK